MTKTAENKHYPSTALIRRVVHSVRACGVTVGSVVIHLDGRIEVSQSQAEPSAAQNDFDRLDAAGLL